MQSFQKVVFVLSLISHTIASIQFYSKFSNTLLDELWANQFYFLIAISLILSGILALSSTIYPIMLILCLRTGIFFLMGLHMEDHIGVELTLLCVLLIEINLYIPSPFNILGSSLVLVFSLFLQDMVSVWNLQIPDAPFHDQLSIGWYSALILFLSAMQAQGIKRSKERKKQIRELDETLLQLSNANTSIQDYAYHIMEQSTTKERQRITREVHDSIGYCMANIIVMIQDAIVIAPQACDALRELLRQIRTVAQEGIQETRKILRQLRAQSLDNPKGLYAIIRLIQIFEKSTGIKINAHYGDAPWHFGNQQDLVIFRCIQEGLTNAITHGKATQIDIRFQKKEGMLNIYIRDNGVGIKNLANLKKGIGFLGMEERLESIGGWVETLLMKKGFALSAWIPCDSPNQLSTQDLERQARSQETQAEYSLSSS